MLCHSFDIVFVYNVSTFVVCHVSKCVVFDFELWANMYTYSYVHIYIIMRLFTLLNARAQSTFAFRIRIDNVFSFPFVQTAGMRL